MSISSADPPPPAAGPLIAWLLAEGRFVSDIGGVIEALAERLNAAGLPVVRATSHVQTLHPQFRAVMRLWRPGRGVREMRPEHAMGDTDTYRLSPLKRVRDTGAWLDVRLDRPGDDDLPMYAELRDEGLTHYVMAPVAFADGMINGVSFATDRAGGFAPEHLGVLRALLPALSAVIEIRAIRRVDAEVLAAYVGRDPASRILAGAIRRGDVRHIRAAIMLTDLRGFTALADAEPEERVVELLNAYFDAVVPAVAEAGGGVLKFIGDGVLAVFDEDKPGDARGRALGAGRAALAALAAARPEDVAPEAWLHMGVALHIGRVAYGNVGSRDRLDFTAVGRDVNLVSRLEALCVPLGRELLMSDEFARGLDEPALELGHFAFKGFRDMRAVYGLPEEDAP